MSANICIIGDSWGTINGFPAQTHRETNLHLEHFLKDAGHCVQNFSIPAGSNCQSISAIQSYLMDLIFRGKQSDFPEYIIWFHTESLRDYSEDMGPYYINEITETLCIQAYQQFKELLNFTKAKAVVIGGQAPIMIDHFDRIVGKVDFLIEDWHSEILEVKLPFTHVVCYIKFIESSLCKDSVQEKNRILNNMEYILDLDKQSNYFPDHCHPGTVPHQNLFNKIKNIFN